MTGRVLPASLILLFAASAWAETSLVGEVYKRLQVDGYSPGSERPWDYPAEATYLIIAGDGFIHGTQSRLLEFADWKRLKGYFVIVTPLSTLASGGSTVSNSDVLEHIRKVYRHEAPYQAAPDMRYILIVGDCSGTSVDITVTSTEVPAWIETIGETFVTDQLYTESLGPGSSQPYYNFNGVVVGRVSASSATECGTMLGKIIRYERRPDPGSWYGNFLGAANFEDVNPSDGYEDGSNALDVTATVYLTLQKYVGFNQGMPDGAFMVTGVPYAPSQFPTYHFVRSSRPSRARIQRRAWGGTGASGMPDPIPAWITGHMLRADSEAGDRVNTILEGDVTGNGAGCILYKGHGQRTGWTNQFAYGTAYIDALANGVQTPVIFSMACATGKFCDSAYPVCMGERLMRKVNGGCLGFCGWTGTGMGSFDHPLTYGIFTALFGPAFDPAAFSYPGSMVDPMGRPVTRSVAEALACGKAWMRRCGEAGEIGGYSEDRCMYSWHQISWLGDPEMLLRATTPKMLTVSHADVLPEGGGTFAVTVQADGTYLSSARVALVPLDDMDAPMPACPPSVALTNDQGDVCLRLPTTHASRYALTVTACDAIPWEETLLAEPLPPMSIVGHAGLWALLVVLTATGAWMSSRRAFASR